MNRLRRDPALSGFLLFGAMVAAGFVVIVAGWHESAYTLAVGRQVPVLISGALGGLVLVLLGAGLMTVLAGRRLAALERLEVEALLDEAAALVARRKGEL
ncbi:MAG: hypothetical protein QOE05_3107 [Actinomycetota bacterium]|nr:hypothetical protein [Actinomycetota bacterium]